jgi:uncharacterized protein
MKEPFIVGPTGRQISLVDPDFSSLSQGDLLSEIATGLAQTFRFSGHTRQLYTVAQHSVLCTKLVPSGNTRAQLLHDASEAYLGDIPTPIKAFLPDYKRLEALFQSRIQDALNCHRNCGVSIADAYAKHTEMEILGFGAKAYGVTEHLPYYIRERAESFLERVWSKVEAKNRWLEYWHLATHDTAIESKQDSEDSWAAVAQTGYKDTPASSRIIDGRPGSEWHYLPDNDDPRFGSLFAKPTHRKPLVGPAIPEPESESLWDALRARHTDDGR